MSMSAMKVKWGVGKEMMSVPFECHDGIEYRIVKVQGKAECSFDNSVEQFNTTDCELTVYFKSSGNTYYYCEIELDEGLYDINLDTVVELVRDEIADRFSVIEEEKKILREVITNDRK